jgi:hypothetical protein
MKSTFYEKIGPLSIKAFFIKKMNLKALIYFK